MEIFGKALLDYQNGMRDTRMRIHRDDGHIDDHDPAVYFRNDPLPFEEPALRRVRGQVLDVGCGAGRHLLWCMARDIPATGIDISAGAIDTCAQRGLDNLHQLDVMTNPLPTGFDTILIFGNNIGIGGDFDGACILMRRLRDALAPGGQILATGLDIAATKNPVHLAYHARNQKAGKRRGEIEMQIEYQGQRDPWVRWYHPEPEEMPEIAKAAGLRLDGLERTEDGFFWCAMSAL